MSSENGFPNWNGLNMQIPGEGFPLSIRSMSLYLPLHSIAMYMKRICDSRPLYKEKLYEIGNTLSFIHDTSIEMSEPKYYSKYQESKRLFITILDKTSLFVGKILELLEEIKSKTKMTLDNIGDAIRVQLFTDDIMKYVDFSHENLED